MYSSLSKGPQQAGILAGSGVTKAEHLGRSSKVAVPFMAPHDPVGRKSRPKHPVGRQEQNFNVLAPDGTAVAVVASQDTAATDKATTAVDEAEDEAAAALANPGQQGLPLKPRPHTDQKGGMLHCLLTSLRHVVMCLAVCRPVKEVMGTFALRYSSSQAIHGCCCR